MNILILISSLEIGGAEKQAVIDANMLADDHKVWLCTFYDGPQKILLKANVNYSVIRKSGYIKTGFELSKFVKTNEIDLIHSSLFSACIISAISTVFKHVKIIWHFHSHEYDIPWVSKLAFTFFSRFHWVNKIVFVSEELKKSAEQRFYFPKNKTEVLYNSTSISTLIEKDNIYSKCIIGFVGRLVPLKRVNFLIELSRFLIDQGEKNYEIWIIGDGNERDRLEKEVLQNNDNNYIKFWGFQEDTSKFYSQFTIFVLPSEEECLSIALIDAGINGIPAIAFDVGGNKEIIQNGETGFVVKDKKELFQKTLALIRDKHLREQFGKKAYHLTLHRFSTSKRKAGLVKF